MTDRTWTPLAALSSRFTANLTALAGRRPDLAADLRSHVPAAVYFIAAAADGITLGTGSAGAVTPLACRLSPAAAAAAAAQLCPTAAYTDPVLVAGEDQGWLWDRLYRLPCRSHPGHRPPLFLAVADLERLWLLLHVHDWRDLMADPRVQLFAGPDAADHFGRSLADDWAVQWPARWATVDAAVWPAGVTMDTLFAAASAARSRSLQALVAAHAAAPPPLAGRPLRVLGFTSRYTTFLQHSMRDWLAAFAALGHVTRLQIERADHESDNTLLMAAASADFRPDLIVLIDHFRDEFVGLPPGVPVVMWVQDRLPHIYTPAAGPRQGRLDYALGYGRLELTRRCGFPATRFLPAMVGVNEARFAADPLPPDVLAPHRCDVSFVSHATAPAEQLVRAAMARATDPADRRVIDEVFQQLRAVYDAGDSIDSGHLLRRLIDRTLLDRSHAGDPAGLLDLFQHGVNNALFRHQSIRWVAETGVDLRLYGRGWDAHPEFARFARGVADNAADLRAIYQASTINLQVTPFGAVHQRLLDGLAAGGFFLLRSTTADAEEAIRRRMWDWSRRVGAHGGRAMLARADAELADLRHRYATWGAVDLADDPEHVYAALEECAATGFTRSANTLWADGDRVAFATRDGLQAKVRHYLAAPDERRDVVRSMRQRVLDTHTYAAITRDLLAMIAADQRPAAAAA